MSDTDLTLNVTTQDGQTHTIPGLSGWTVMELIREAGLPIKAECGGALACATCHVYVADAWIPRLLPPREDESAMIDDMAYAPQQNSRLSCQIVMRDDLNGLALRLAPNHPD